MVWSRSGVLAGVVRPLHDVAARGRGHVDGALPHLDAPHPLDVVDADPAGHDGARRRAVVRRDGLAVHRVGDQRVVLERLRERHGPVDLDGVEALHEHVQEIARRVALEAGELEDRAQRHARPLRDADGAEPPLRARGHLAHELLEEPAPVARALDVADDGARGQPQQLVERDVQRPLERAALHAEPPRARVHDRRRRVVPHEEVARRRQVAAQRLEPRLLVQPVVDEDRRRAAAWRGSPASAPRPARPGRARPRWPRPPRRRGSGGGSRDPVRPCSDSFRPSRETTRIWTSASGPTPRFCVHAERRVAVRSHPRRGAVSWLPARRHYTPGDLTRPRPPGGDP